MLVSFNDGRSEIITVRFPSERLDELIRSVTDDAHQIALFCNKPPAWVQTLTPKSLAAVINEMGRSSSEFGKRLHEYGTAKARHLSSVRGEINKVLGIK